MPTRTHALIPAILFWGTSGALAAASAKTSQEDLVRVSVLSEHAGVAPGHTVWIGVRFEIQDGWYIYWPGQNDSGTPTEIEPKGPECVSFGSIQWPAPTRQMLPGDIIDHVFRRSVTALIPMTVAPNAEIGTNLTVSVDTDWMVCQDVCIPGSKTASITLPVVAEMSEPDPTHARAFAESRARIPHALPESETVLQIAWDGTSAVIRARGAFKMAYYPDTQAAPVEDLFHTGSVEADKIRIRTRSPHLLSGIIEVFARDGNSRLFRVRSSPPATSG